MKVAEPSPGYLFGRVAGYLLDVNVWLALAAQSHPHHASATQFWIRAQQEGQSLWFNRVTALGLVRLLCQPAVMGQNVQKTASALALYKRFLDQSFVRLAIEPPGVDQALEEMAANEFINSRDLTDVYLLTFAKLAGQTLVTFDAAVATRAPTHTFLLKP